MFSSMFFHYNLLKIEIKTIEAVLALADVSSITPIVREAAHAWLIIRHKLWDFIFLHYNKALLQYLIFLSQIFLNKFGLYNG